MEETRIESNDTLARLAYEILNVLSSSMITVVDRLGRMEETR